MKQYDTLVDALRDLENRGDTVNFNAAQNCLEGAAINLKLYPADFEIAAFYRFEGSTDPADSSIVYAIAGKNSTRGYW